MMRGIITICAVLLLAPLLLACAGGQLLPGESNASPDRPGKSDMGRERGRKSGAGGRSKSKSRLNATNVNFDAFGDERRPGKSWAGGLNDGGGNVKIERRKSIIHVAPGDEHGGQSQRDDRNLLNLKSGQPTSDQSGQLGGGSSTTSTKSRKKEDEERDSGRRASLLSGSEGIRDKLGRSGRRGPGKSLG